MFLRLFLLVPSPTCWRELCGRPDTRVTSKLGANIKWKVHHVRPPANVASFFQIATFGSPDDTGCVNDPGPTWLRFFKSHVRPIGWSHDASNYSRCVKLPAASELGFVFSRDDTGHLMNPLNAIDRAMIYCADENSGRNSSPVRLLSFSRKSPLTSRRKAHFAACL
jgi:hypothetical protein